MTLPDLDALAAQLLVSVALDREAAAAAQAYVTAARQEMAALDRRTRRQRRQLEKLRGRCRRLLVMLGCSRSLWGVNVAASTN